jgi:hypothetical protein
MKTVRIKVIEIFIIAGNRAFIIRDALASMVAFVARRIVLADVADVEVLGKEISRAEDGGVWMASAASMRATSGMKIRR